MKAAATESPRREALPGVRLPRPRRVLRLPPGRIVEGLTAPLLLLAIWELVVRFELVASYMLPAPAEAARALVEHRQMLLNDAMATLSVAAAGLLLALVIALVLAVATTESRRVRNAVLPLVVAIEGMPKIAFAPLLVLWLGIGAAPKVALACTIATFPIAINAMRGLRDVDPDALDVLRVLKASRLKILLYLRLPNCIQPVFDGLRIAVPGCLIGSILAEFIASNDGLGHRLLVSSAALDLDVLFAALFVIGLASGSGFLLVGVLERRVVRWRRT